MNLYPALRAKMGTWDYYVVKMQMKDLVKEVGLASDIYKNKTLDEAIQRSLNEGRIKKEIVQYLGKREDRFFSSIVVAALGGNPTFHPVKLADDPRFALIRVGDIEDTFGVLTFDGGQRYFALDGQHRLKAIQALIQQSEEDIPKLPDGFEHEEVSVIMLVRSEEDDDKFFREYRRIFSSLNRYAKPTDRDTNIIMDEDDAFAILTRRLLTEHEFFKSSEASRLKTKGKNFTAKDEQFTTLQALYNMNEILLKTHDRRNTNDNKWFKMNERDFKQFRPSEEELDDLYDELKVYWDALIHEIPELNNVPIKMRKHNVGPDSDSDEMDHLLFWPIGQEMFVEVVRSLLDELLKNEIPVLGDVRKCVSVMKNVDWNLHHSPWRGLILVQDKPGGRWRMRNEARNDAVSVGQKILEFRLGINGLSEEGLKMEWSQLLIPQITDQGKLDSEWKKAIEPLR